MTDALGAAKQRHAPIFAAPINVDGAFPNIHCHIAVDLATLMRDMSESAVFTEPSAAPDAEVTREALVRLHPDAWAWAVSCCRGDRQTAHDALHDAYVRILDGKAVFEGRSSLKTWVFGVIRMTALAVRRRRRFLDIMFEPIGAGAETVPAPEDIGGGSRRLTSAVRALPNRQREIVALVFAHDLTVEEAAGVMGISVGAARQHYMRAKEKLRASLRPILEQSHG
jgi:RNA polymerase sigma-70 factor (ECF subfamily)